MEFVQEVKECVDYTVHLIKTVQCTVKDRTLLSYMLNSSNIFINNGALMPLYSLHIILVSLKKHILEEDVVHHKVLLSWSSSIGKKKFQPSSKCLGT